MVKVNTSQSPAFIQMKMASQDLEASKSEWMVQVMYGYMRLARSLYQEFFSGVGRCLAVGGLRNGEGVSRVPTNFLYNIWLPILSPIWAEISTLLCAAHPG